MGRLKSHSGVYFANVLTQPRILIIDDDSAILRLSRQVLGSLGEVITHEGGSEALRFLQTEMVDLVFVDLMMPGLTGLEVIQSIRAIAPDVTIVMFTGYPTVETAVAALKMGAFDYITKPFEVEQLQTIAKKALDYKRLRDENKELKSQIRETSRDDDTPVVSPTGLRTLSLARRVAATDANILLLGESGTGKDVLAKRIHRFSPRADQAFIPVDCAAIPENLVESELFGHERGSFSGADQRRDGLVSAAEGGTLFLDEIAELPLGQQVKLLRVIQDRKVRRVGGNSWRTVDFRLITATNQDLKKKVQQGLFRQDLYFRLAVVALELPPLRDRVEDIPSLALRFLHHLSGTSARRFSQEALNYLLNQPWPGNIRELRNVVERAAYLCPEHTIEIGDFGMPLDFTSSIPPQADSLPYAIAKRKHLEEFEATYIQNLVMAHGGNASAAARTARISRTTLLKLMKRHSIER